MDNKLLNDISGDERVLKTTGAWGVYYPNRYYFTVQTGRTRSEVGLSENIKELSPERQRQLQRENYPVMLHEYLHYLQDLGTMAGQACLFYHIMTQSLFTKLAKPGMTTSVSLGSDEPYHAANSYYNSKIFIRTLEGCGRLPVKMHQIEKIRTKSVELKALRADKWITKTINIPEISYVQRDIKGDIRETIRFGSFYLYEGMAYEVDQIVSQRANRVATRYGTATEYTVMRNVARYYMPDMEPRTMVSLAIMALQYMDCGATFIRFVMEVRKYTKKGMTQQAVVEMLKPDVRKHLKQYFDEFNAQIDNYRSIFFGRTSLYRAISMVGDTSISQYRKRMTHPCFEVDLIFEDKIDRLLSEVQLCDFMYIFKAQPGHTEDPEFNRDFIGTAMKDMDTSIAMKVLTAFDHYACVHTVQHTEKIESRHSEVTECPFYTTCDLTYRKEHAEICRNKPWRIYELQHNNDQEYCWYGRGVLETKGLTTPK